MPSGLESNFLATMASATSLIEITAGIQKRTAEALQSLSGHSDEDALRRLRRVEDAIQVLTTFPDGRQDWRDRPNRRQPTEATGRATWPAEPLTAREEAMLRVAARNAVATRDRRRSTGSFTSPTDVPPSSGVGSWACFHGRMKAGEPQSLIGECGQVTVRRVLVTCDDVRLIACFT